MAEREEMYADSPFDLERIEAIASALDLREPNKDALTSIALVLGQHYKVDGRPPPYEGVCDCATGVGKTYIMVGAVDYFAAEGVRNFVVIAPGKTILNKTVANFTRGSRKSLVESMSVDPVVVTAENFNSAAMREAMDDPQQVKVFIFTVQSLIDPRTKVSRKTRKFQEGLGEAFYDHLKQADDLFILADEHHSYYGQAFSNAIRDLDPWALIGLTATPHRQTPEEMIIYRYPLAAAIADRYVKTPVLVGRKDDLRDPSTKLADGVTLLELKEQAVNDYCHRTGADRVQPLMLVIAPDIEEAGEIEAVLKSPSFAEGRYADKILTVHSSAPDEALEALEQLEEPGSPYSIVVSVGMLKEGWDVKGVYVICSLRASVSDLLTEQTLGRGLRLPFGAYTDIELLDTLDVLAHEKYEELLKKAGAINEKFVDHRTRAVLKQDSQGRVVSRLEKTEVSAPILVNEKDESQTPQVVAGQPMVASVGEQQSSAANQLTAMQTELAARPDAGQLQIPQLKMTPVRSTFSLADITDFSPFQRLGERISADPDAELRRTVISARTVESLDGLRHTELVTSPAADKVHTQPQMFPLEDLRSRLLDQLLVSAVVPARPKERKAAEPILDAVFEGLGDNAQENLSRYFDRISARLIETISQVQRSVAAQPDFEEVVEVSDFQTRRFARPDVSTDRTGPFKRGVAYEYRKSLFAQDWFDSSTERTVANLLDEAREVKYFVRLQRDDLPILFAGGRSYNPDFIVVQDDNSHDVLEVKMNREMASETVLEKREAAKRWANHVSADPKVRSKWDYLLVSESDVMNAKGSWNALRGLAS
jgi:type III restriction enzyme